MDEDNEFFGIENYTPTRSEAKSLTACGNGIKFYKRGDYFDSLCRFNNAVNVFNIPILLPSLKRSNERVFHQIIDCLLC